MGTRKNRLTEAVLTSTHNLCVGAKIRKNGIPLFYYIQVGLKWVFNTRTCYPVGRIALWPGLTFASYKDNNNDGRQSMGIL